MDRKVIESTSRSLLLPLISSFSLCHSLVQKCICGGRTFKGTRLAILTLNSCEGTFANCDQTSIKKWLIFDQRFFKSYWNVETFCYVALYFSFIEFKGNLQCSWSWHGPSPYTVAWRERKGLFILQPRLVVQDLAPFVVQASGSLEISFLNLSPTILVHLGFQLVVKAFSPRTADF